MENVFLLMKYHLGPNNGFKFPKFDYQINTLKQMGYNVYYIGIDFDAIYLCNNNNRKFLFKVYNPFGNRIPTIFFYNALYKSVIKTFSLGINFKYAYIRSMPITWFYSIALKKIKASNCDIIVEIPTHPIEKEIRTEERFFRRSFFIISNYLLRKKSVYVDLFALIGEKSCAFAGRPAINIENGIDIESIPLRNPSNVCKNEIHLLGLANMAKWHGYDRVIEGIREYYQKGGKLNVVLHLIGGDSDGSLEKWRLLVENYNLHENVIFEGKRYGVELNQIFDKCQVAIGSIGMHRINYSTASTLKIREYMARGIPFVISTEDLAINNLSGCAHRIPSNDTPLNISCLIEFIERIDFINLKDRMRDYAKQSMTWATQFENVIRKVEDLKLKI